MSKLERLFHALLFEALAVVIGIIAVKLSADYPTFDTSLTIVLMSLTAVLWNMLFNWIFDQFYTGPREQRRVILRIFHTLAFEGGLLIFTLPIIVYMLNLNWLEAFLMDIGLTLLIVIYTFFFNLAYDHLRAAIIKNRR